jgi:stage V sporulation protein G
MEQTEKATDFDCLAVTNVQVYPFKETPTLGHMKGMASIVLNDQLQVRGLRIMVGDNGLFVSYPLDPFYKGEDYRSLCFPVTRQLREHIEACVLEKYQASFNPVEWRVRFRLDDDSIETIVKETDRVGAINKARAKLANRFGDALDDAEVEVAEEA